MSLSCPGFGSQAVTHHILSADGTRDQIPGIVQIQEETIYLSQRTSIEQLIQVLHTAGSFPRESENRILSTTIKDKQRVCYTINTMKYIILFNPH